jgi:DNA-binding beta-propeller fold protein YncE
VLFVAAWLAYSAAQAQPNTSVLGTTSILVGPVAGTGSVVVAVTPSNGFWTATPNAAWLSVSLPKYIGSTNEVVYYDANPGATRFGTLTIAGQTLAVTQAGSNYVAASSLTTLASGLGQPQGVAVDDAGNVYVADTGYNAIKQWTRASNTLTTLVSGQAVPSDVAVNGVGNVYIADTGQNAIKQCTTVNSNLTTLVSSGLDYPTGVAVNGAGNVYIADTSDNAIKQWTLSNSNLTTLVSTGLNLPFGVAVDVAGNVYIADTYNNAIKQWTAANSNVTTLVSSGLNSPVGIAVDGAGNVYVADTFNGALREWSAANNTVSTLLASGLNDPYGVAVDIAGNVYLADTFDHAIKELPYAFVDPTAKSEGSGAGNDALPTVLPATANLLPPFAPSSDQPWLTITGVTNGAVSFSFAANTGLGRTAHISLLGQTIRVAQNAASLVLGESAILEGPAQGSDSIVLAATSNTVTWTATANASWLHLAIADQSGSGSTNLIFTFDANPGGTRSGTLTIGGQMLTVTQAGSTYIQADSLTTLVSAGLNNPNGLAVDGAGNVYIADTANAAIKVWTVTNNTVTTLASAGLVAPYGIAVDGNGNVYVADSPTNEIKEWTPVNSNITTLVSSGLFYPRGVVVDAVGNVYIADTADSAIVERTPDGAVSTVLDVGLNWPYGVAVDIAGNIYVADTFNNAIEKWTPTGNTFSTLVSGANFPFAVAVDGSGNVYFASSGDQIIRKWTAASGTVTTLVSQSNILGGEEVDFGVTVDEARNIYIAGTDSNIIQELPYAFVDPTAKLEGLAAGTDALPPVLPVTQNLLGPFAPFSDQTWLTISGVTNGLVSFSFTANTGPSRTANITLLGQTIPVAQSGYTYTLATNALLEGANAGSDGVALTVNPNAGAWTATANDPWLHLAIAGQSGTGSMNVVFTFDANPGTTRSGTLTIAGQTLTITQSGAIYFLNTSALSESNNAGSDSVVLTVIPQIATWTSTANAPWLHLGATSQGGTGSTNLVFSFDANAGATRAGTLTIAGLTVTVIQGSPSYSLGTTGRLEGPAAGIDSVVLLVTPNFGSWLAIANAPWLHLTVADQGGTGSTNVVFTYDQNPAATRSGTLTIGGQRLTVTQAGATYVAAQPLTTLVSSGLSRPEGVALDGSGNVYIADFNNNALYEWTITNDATTQLVPQLRANPPGPPGPPLPPPGPLQLDQPDGVALDSSGNVYIADFGDGTINEWTVANSNVTTLVSSGLNQPESVAVDAIGNLYIADSEDNAIKEWMPATGVLTSLVSSGLSYPDGVAVDAAGRVYIADYGNNAIKEWTATSNTMTTLVSAGLSSPIGLAVDGAGNVYIGDSGHHAVKKWTAANDSVTTLLSSGLSQPFGVALDATGNIYLADANNQAVKELPYAFVDPTHRLETMAAGSDALPTVLPATENLLPPFAPTSDQSWLTITGITNGVVSYSFTANTGPARTAHISLLGQIIPVTQGLLGTPSTVSSVQLLGGGAVQFAFTNTPSASFTVLSTTNLSWPLSQWAVIGTPTEYPPGQYQFTDIQATTTQRFYIVRSP